MVTVIVAGAVFAVGPTAAWVGLRTRNQCADPLTAASKPQVTDLGGYYRSLSAALVCSIAGRYLPLAGHGGPPAHPLRPPVTAAPGATLTPSAAVTALPGCRVTASYPAGVSVRRARTQGLPPAGLTVGTREAGVRVATGFHLARLALHLAAVTGQSRRRPLRTLRLDLRLMRVATRAVLLLGPQVGTGARKIRCRLRARACCSASQSGPGRFSPLRSRAGCARPC
jgi:hypothetical protein